MAPDLLFSVPLSGGALSPLLELSSKTDAFQGITVIGDTLYGSIVNSSGGSIFSIPVSGGSPKILTSFTGYTTNLNNGFPDGELTLFDGSLYGSAADAGKYANGEIFSIPLNGGVPTVVYSFDSGFFGPPSAGLTLVGDTFYGTGYDGPNSMAGVVFALTVPEPSTFVILLLPIAVLLARRRPSINLR